MTTNGHTSTQFDQELGEIHSLVVQMGKLVENQVHDVITVVSNADASLIESIIANDHRVNELEVRIDEACDRMVALRQPAANDMRTVMGVVKIVTDFERIGDEAKNIANIAQNHIPGEHAEVMQSRELRRSLESALKVLQQSLQNLTEQDSAAAVQLIRNSQTSDSNALGYIVRPLVMEMMEAPGTISIALDVMVISKAIERIVEHAINISEHVVYMVKGQDVRHIPVEEIERRISS